MSIKRINMTDLRGYEGREGLILQGCGGDPQEWIDGINDLLTKNEILLDGTKFKNEDCAVFDNNGSTCILYEFTEDTKINMGRLAMWRISSHAQLGGKWLSDFVDHQLGGFHPTKAIENEKPDCPLIGEDGNIYNLMGIASRTLRENGMADKAKEMTTRITQGAQSYDEALCIIGEYVNITSADDVDEDMNEGMDIMALHDDGTICFLGWAGRMSYHYNKSTIKRIDYEKYIDGKEDYLI